MRLTKSGTGHFIRQSQVVDSPLKSESDLTNSESDPEPAQSDNEVLNESLIFEQEEEADEVFSKPERRYRTNTCSVTLPDNNLNSQELSLLGLNFGINCIKYVTQGRKPKILLGRVFLWNENEKIVVSDIDGTLTKSDLMGHICYAVGKDWSRSGAASCYSSIAARKYKVMYLTSRSINQIESTMKLIEKMQQDGLGLPIGPLILSNSGMFKSLFRELSNRSKVFKECALLEILQLFPSHINPLWAGFGNRAGDAIAYMKSGISKKRIFIFTNRKVTRPYQKIDDFGKVMAEFNEHFPKLP